MGSLCCVAAKSDSSNSASGDFSFLPHDPYWRTNTSFSPPSSGWDVHGLIDGISCYGSSTSSNANVLVVPTFLRLFIGHLIILNLRQEEIKFVSNYRVHQEMLVLDVHSHLVLILVTLNLTETSQAGAFSFQSLFILYCILLIYVRDRTSDSTDACSWSSGTTSSTDSVEVAEPVLGWDNDSTKAQRVVAPSIFKCGLCNRYLSQKSPWGSRSILRNRDMPVTGVIPCQHVFHAECLDQSTPKTQRNDPACPICTAGQEGELFKSHNILPRLKPLYEDGQSTTPWGCALAGDCVESAVNVPRNRLRKNLSLRGNSSKDFPSKIQKSNTSVANQVSLVRSRGKDKASW